MHCSSPFSSPVGPESKKTPKKKCFRWLSNRQARRVIRCISGQDVIFVIVLTLILVFVHFQNRILKASGGSQVYSPVIAKKLEGSNLSIGSERRGPRSYLPLAQHLKYLKRRKPSLQDMAYGSHEPSLRDLKPTNLSDIDNCKLCTENANLVSSTKIPSSAEADLARTLVKLVSFHSIKSMVTFPCASETLWIFTFVETMKKISPSFMHYCGIDSDEVVVGMMKFYRYRDLGETEFIVYSPNVRGSLPQVDLMFAWKGLDHLSFDTLLTLFRNVEEAGIRYTIIRNNPSVENAVMVESARETYSVVRSGVQSPNFRGYPFGFGEAERVIPLHGSQLLFYNTTLLRDKW